MMKSFFLRLVALVRIAIVPCAALGLGVGPGGWALAGQTEAPPAAPRPDDHSAVNMIESAVGPYVLPDPLAGPQGRIGSAAQWPSRRIDLLRLFEDHVYGRAPGRPESVEFQQVQAQKALDGKALRKQVDIVSRQAGRQHRFTLDLYLPQAARSPAPLFLLLNHRNTSTIQPQGGQKSGQSAADYLIGQGFAVAEIQTSELAPDHPVRFRDGVIGLFEEEPGIDAGPSAWGAIAAWAWGARRALDYLRTDPAVDRSRIALVGHSRGGKAALWAGALDERFTMVIANDSGEGGAALARRRYGETIAIMTRSFPHWFAQRYQSYANREAELPVDQHMLLALVAPRLLYVSSATEDRWADPRGEFLAFAHASSVYALWGDRIVDPDAMPDPDRMLATARRGYHIRSGHHDLKVADWEHFVRFARRAWLGSPRKPPGPTGSQPSQTARH